MSLRKITRNTSLVPVGLALVALLSVGKSYAGSALDWSDIYRYRIWVESLKTERDVSEHRLYPFDRTYEETLGESGPSDRLVTAARSLIATEDILVREWDKARRYDAGRCLAVARSYKDAGEYGESMRWYRRVQQADGGRVIESPDLRHERFAVAVMTEDSLQITGELLNLVGLRKLKDDQGTLELAFRWLLLHDDAQNLDLLMRKVEGQVSELGPRLRYWFAFNLARRGDRDGCFAELRALMDDDEAVKALDGVQGGWVLRTFADILYLSGRRADALNLYTLLAELPDPEVGGWGRYQLANHHFLAGDYDAAGALYSEFCGREAAVAWQGRACEMAGLVDRLASIRKEGGTYGIDGIHRR